MESSALYVFDVLDGFNLLKIVQRGLRDRVLLRDLSVEIDLFRQDRLDGVFHIGDDLRVAFANVELDLFDLLPVQMPAQQQAAGADAEDQRPCAVGGE